MNNETKIVITGNTISAENALETLGSKLDSTSRKMFDLSGVAGTLSGALTITAFVGFIKSSIDAADRLNDLSKVTSLTVEQLAGVSLAAKQSGSDLEGTAHSISKLSENMGKDGEKFAKLGITAKDPIEAFKQLADVFNSIKDPQQQAAFGAAALGKSWREAVPLLAEGGQRIGEMIARGTALSGPINDAAKQADLFNDRIVELKVQAGGLGTTIANSMLPGLTKITAAMAEAAREGGFLDAVMVGMAATWNELFVGTPQEKRIKEIKKELDSLRDMQGGRNVSKYGLESINKEMLKLEKEMEQLLKIKERLDNPPAPKPANSTTPPSGIDAFIGGTPKTDKNAATLINMEAEAYRKYAEALGFTSEQIKVFEFSQTGATASQILAAQAASDSITASNLQIKIEKDKAKAIEEAGQMAEKQAEKQRDLNIKFMEEQSAMNAIREQSTLSNLEGDPRIEAERAIAIAQEDARYQIKAQAIQNEMEKMRADGLLTEEIAQQQMQRREILEADHQSRLTTISNRYLTQRQQFERMTTSAQISTISGMLMQATAAGATRNRELFELNKVAGIANAIVSTYEGANKALGMLGPFGLPVAAAIVAGGLANVAIIAETKFGGGMPSGGGAGSGIPSLATNLPASGSGTPPSAPNAPTPVQVSIYNTGNVMSPEFVDGTIIPQIRDSIANSDVLIIDPRSRQAQVLTGV